MLFQTAQNIYDKYLLNIYNSFFEMLHKYVLCYM